MNTEYPVPNYLWSLRRPDPYPWRSIPEGAPIAQAPGVPDLKFAVVRSPKEYDKSHGWQALEYESGLTACTGKSKDAVLEKIKSNFGMSDEAIKQSRKDGPLSDPAIWYCIHEHRWARYPRNQPAEIKSR